MDKISIIVPVYNAEKSLVRCLQSLQNQTHTNIEVIMVDDGSSDQSSDICQKYSSSDKRFRYIRQANSGVSAARNKGISIATGEYIGFCDADDWIDIGMFSFLYNLAVVNTADISICSFYIDSPNKAAQGKMDSIVYQYSAEEAIVEMHRGGRFMGHLCDKLFKKSVIAHKLLRTDLALFEDMVFVWECFRDSRKIVYQDVTLYHYIQNVNSAMNKFKPSSWSIQKACSIMLEYMQSTFPENIVFAQRTVLYGNIILARQLSEAGLFNRENYSRVRASIDESNTRDAVALLKPASTRDLAFFRCGRCVFNLYIWILKNRRILIHRSKKEVLG